MVGYYITTIGETSNVIDENIISVDDLDVTRVGWRIRDLNP